MAGGESFNMAEEFADVDFNEARLEKRLVRTMETLSRQPDKSMRASSGNCCALDELGQKRGSI